MGKVVNIIILVIAVSIDGTLVNDSAGIAPSPTNAAQQFIGTWQLVSVMKNGQPDPERGPHPKGLIYYDRAGHMAVQIVPDRPRPKYAGSEPTPEEAKTAVTGYTAYFGTYAVDEHSHVVTHHRVGNIIPGAPIDVVRRYEFVSGNRLILTPVEEPNSSLTWERVK